MIDPTKDPYQIGKVIPLDVVLRRTVDLIQYCEDERRTRNLPEIGYEVGTEETNGGLTSTDTYQTFIEELKVELGKRGLPMGPTNNALAARNLWRARLLYGPVGERRVSHTREMLENGSFVWCAIAPL